MADGQQPTDPRRSGARFRTALPAALHADGERRECSAEDLGREGALLRGRLPLPADPFVAVEISTPSGDRSVRVAGRVMHAHDDPESGETRLGIQFLDLSSEDAETVGLILSRVVEGMAPSALAGIDPSAGVAEIRRSLERVTPAHRAALAARGGPAERALLKHDADPHVLEALARNPKINLPEIKALLRRRDLLPSTLEIVAGDRRWAGDEELRVSVATHPRVTFATADRIVRSLGEAALDRLARRPGLQVGVKQKLMARLSRKHRGPG